MTFDKKWCVDDDVDCWVDKQKVFADWVVMLVDVDVDKCKKRGPQYYTRERGKIAVAWGFYFVVKH